MLILEVVNLRAITTFAVLVYALHYLCLHCTIFACLSLLTFHAVELFRYL